MWQVSGAHGRIDAEQAVQDMFRYHDAGFTAWDLADHYGPAEDFMGEFRRRMKRERGEIALSSIQAFTKWVPRPMPMSREVVERAIDTSLRRMDVEALDLLQFHWWDYQNPEYLTALHHLADLQKAGKIKHLGLTNFDTERLQLILGEGIRIICNQVQYSLVDLRPEVRMAPVCREEGISLLAYGTLCGGLLSETCLGRPEPDRGSLHTASQQKYRQMIDAWGSWSLFQELLGALKAVADRHQSSIPNVATRCILDRPEVAGVIIGVRLGVAEHREDNGKVWGLKLMEDDRQRIETVTRKGKDLFRAIGDCGDEYR